MLAEANEGAGITLYVGCWVGGACGGDVLG